MNNHNEAHSSLPWFDVESIRDGLLIQSSDGLPIATMLSNGDPFKVALANAAFIVQACNHHAMLVVALKRAEQFIRNGIEYGYINEPKAGQPEAATLGIISHAIAQAEGGAA